MKEINQEIKGDNNIQVAGNIVINQPKNKVVQQYPPGCIGYEVIKRNYVDYLKTRYHEYKEYEVGKEKMRYGIFPSELKKRFKIGQANTIFNLPCERFDELVMYIQQRIDKTMLAKMKGKNHKNYISFDEYMESQT